MKNVTPHQSFLLARIINGICKTDIVRQIWEVGSRDGKESQLLAELFPLSKLIAFEPNPDTFADVYKVALESNGRIRAINAALLDANGLVTLHKIDTEKTLTDWPDGNPGASSIYLARSDYRVETYAQIPVEVKSLKASTLIQNENLPTPNLIWMDVQGAEELALKGFEEYLSEVDFIYVELSLIPLYVGQPLALQIINFLSKDFLWHSNLTLGDTQFDALFVNKRHKNMRLLSRNIYLNFSLKSGFGFGIRKPWSSILRVAAIKLLRPFKRILLKALQRSESRILGLLTANVILRIFSRVKRETVRLVMRQILSFAQPSNPLSDQNLPIIDVAIPCVEKDLNNLNLVIEGVMTNVKNPIDKIKLIAPRHLTSELKSRFPNCDVFSDEEIVSPETLTLIECLVPKNRKGWVLQQIIKIRVSAMSDNIATLVLDADTVLLTPKVWLDSNNKQILCTAFEYHYPYKLHQQRVWGWTHYPISFVTHHQLMIRDSLREMFGGNCENLTLWLSLADFKHNSALSEYDSYGEWMMMRKPNQVMLAKWNNISVKLDFSVLTYREVSKEFLGYGSISNHSHLI